MKPQMGGLIPVAAELTDDIVQQLPEEVQEMVIAEQMKQEQIIDALEVAVKRKRDDAVKFRAASGIETEWAEDEDFYEGIDDANRGEPRMIKPYHPSGVVTTIHKGQQGKSTIFMNITRQYVDSAAASVSELGNPTDDRNFVLKATPDPELEDEVDSITPMPNPQNNPKFANMTIGDFAKKKIEENVKSALAAQTQIDEWLIDCQWHAGMRKAVKAAAKIGTGVMKGPVPVIRKRTKTQKITNADGSKSIALVVEHETCPASEEISAWRIYPDPACGNDIHKGNYIFEHDSMNSKQLQDLKELPGYLKTRIDEVIAIGPSAAVKDYNTDKNKVTRDDVYDIWYYYGLLKRDEIVAMGIRETLDPDDPEDAKALVKMEQLEAMPCVVTMANDKAIKASLNPLDTGEFPYDFLVWEQREGTPWGRGIARIMRPAQRVVNAAIRNMMDNASLSGGIQVAFRKGKVKPMGTGKWKVSNVGFWEITDEEITDIKQAISFIELPSRQAEIMAIIKFGQKMAEDITGMPLLLQGQSGSAPDTVGGMTLLNNNATATRRMIARQVDDQFTEPHIRRYYNWILMYGKDNMKVQMTIDARGSQALVERDIQRQYTQTLLNYAKDPAYGLNPKKVMREALKAENMVPGDVQYSEEEQKKIDSTPPAPAPVVQAAQINTASREKIAAAQVQAQQQTEQIRAQATVQAVQERTARDDSAMQQKLDADQKMHANELALQERIAMLNYATKQNISLQEAKTQLATVTMKLQTEKELAGAAAQLQSAMHTTEHRVSQENLGYDHAHADSAMLAQQAHEKELMRQKHEHEINVANLQPVVQVPGRAANGQALSQMSGK